MTKFISIASILILAFFSASCTTYVPVQQQGQYEYNPGYNPDNTVADAILAAAIFNGVSGYYGPGHVFYPQTMYGGVPGYYVGSVFHTSPQYRTTIVNNYSTGRSEFTRNPQSYAQSHPDVVKTISKPVYGQSAMPNYSNNTGGVTRSAPTSSGMPAYGSNTGGVTRSTTTPKPTYGSSTGGVSRSVPTSSPSRSPSSSSRSTRR